MQFALNVPINSVSFGQVSTALLREAYKRNLEPSIFPIGGSVDLSSQTEDADFFKWIKNLVGKSIRKFDRDIPVVKLWHLNGGLESFSRKQVLLTFYELDSPTVEEVNTVRNNDKVLFTSKYTANLFKEKGAENVDTINLGLDESNFYKKDKQYFSDERITFALVGKYEKRKHHLKLLKHPSQ